jgi:hypothetical protein
MEPAETTTGNLKAENDLNKAVKQMNTLYYDAEEFIDDGK